MSKLIGYARVSTDKQTDSGLGLQAQQESIQHYCKATGHHLVRIEVDQGISGRHTTRPSLKQALISVLAGEADGIVVSKLDRLARSARDFANILSDLQAAHKTLVCIDLGVDTSTPSGQMISQVVAAMAEFESKLIGERTRDAMRIAAAQGRHMGRPLKTIPPNILESMQRMRAEGYTLREVAADFDLSYNLTRRLLAT